MPHVYFIQPAELVGTDRYKIGMTTKSDLSRVRSYKVGSRYLCIMDCQDALETEQRLISKFKSEFKLIAGNEYFQIDNEPLALTLFFQVVTEIHHIQPIAPKEVEPVEVFIRELKAEALDKPTQWFVASVNSELTHTQDVCEGFNSINTMRESFNQWLLSQGDKSTWTANRFGRSISQVLGPNKLKRIDAVVSRGYELTPTLLLEQVLAYTKRSDLFSEYLS